MKRARFTMLVVLWGAVASGQDVSDDREGIEFFEKKIRPVLVEHCYECHSSRAKNLEGSLSLETRAALLKGGDQGAAVTPGDLDKSLLIRAIRYTDEDLQMPPKPLERLPAEVVADFEAWVKRGAPDPRTGPQAASPYAVDIEGAKSRWPFTPPIDSAVPAVENTAWPQNAIDHFVLAKLAERGLAPVGDADPRTLLRRITYDLTGLPPTVEEVEEFLRACELSQSASLPVSASAAIDGETRRRGDKERKALEAVIDRLLASQAYGERWGRHWLDVIRYADTAGDNSDYPIPQMYKYRNWVIQAFNDDLPFDEFIRRQIAGDLLPAASTAEKYEHTIATGYLASARRFGSRVSDYPQHLTIEDTIDNLGRAFLGLSLNCARCHNHKFDPITAEDYYGLYGILHSTRYPWPGIELEKKQRDLVPLEDAQVVAAATAERKKQADIIAEELKACEEAKKAGDQLQKAATDRLAALRKQETPAETLKEAEEDVAKAKEQVKALDERLKAAKKKKTDLDNTPLPLEMAYAVAEGKKIENCKVQLKGDPERLAAEVPRRFPIVLGGYTLPAEEQGSGRRELAEWIASKDNPLTARVFVNRLWHHHFGRGLVATPNDFGKQGRPPTHPELLDWLAVRFASSGWSVKAMQRLILTSRVYQLASSEAMTNDQAPITKQIQNPKSRFQNPSVLDPANDLLWRAHRRRLDAESIRDTLLMLGGNLDRSIGAAHPFPPQPEWDYTQHKPFKAVYDTDRRSVYLMTQRIQRHPFMAVFDGPDTSASTGSRVTSTTTLQSLFFLNDPFVHEQAGRLAAQLLTFSAADDQRIERVYQLLFSRPPLAHEAAGCREHLARLRERKAASDAGNAGDSGQAGKAESHAWESLVRVLLRTNEFVYVD